MTTAFWGEALKSLLPADWLMGAWAAVAVGILIAGLKGRFD